MSRTAMEYGCIGNPLGHSWSVDIHRLLGLYEYRLTELAPDEVGPLLTARRFRGINVTIPYKQTVIPYLDEIDPEAAAVGAVNTIVNRGGRLCGYNTDLYGMRQLLAVSGISLTGRSVAILGTGGTSLTARAVARGEGARRIIRVSRTPSEADEISYMDLRRIAPEVDVLINTTPVGMFPYEDASPVWPDDFPALQSVVDVVYRPMNTWLVNLARSRGVRAVNGLYMLVAQAAQAAAMFFDDPGMTEKTSAVFRRVRADKQNVVLIGMPGCGKSTVGRLLADRLGRHFFDSDEAVAAKMGMPVPKYIRTAGESAFRDAETYVLHELSRQNGAVIATGGGAVTRQINVETLSQNGLLVLLDRPLGELPVTSGRPLSSDREALARLFREREPLYRAAADLVLPVTGSPEETADRLAEALKKEVIS
ncbi:MAG: shikimate dehydrogenase [Clostridia bacterium]|nr:shikimate dehydrogenase [Clostridia bacterium]